MLQNICIYMRYSMIIGSNKLSSNTLHVFDPYLLLDNVRSINVWHNDINFHFWYDNMLA